MDAATRDSEGAPQPVTPQMRHTGKERKAAAMKTRQRTLEALDRKHHPRELMGTFTGPLESFHTPKRSNIFTSAESMTSHLMHAIMNKKVPRFGDRKDSSAPHPERRFRVQPINLGPGHITGEGPSF